MANSAGSSPTTATTTDRASARWAILRNAIVNKQTPKQQGSTCNGSIHRFAGFGFLQRQRLPRTNVKPLTELLTKIRLPEDFGSDDWKQWLAEELKVSLMALSAVRPDNWIWDFEISSEEKSCNPMMMNCEEQESNILTMLDRGLISSNGGTEAGSHAKHRLRHSTGSGWIQNSLADADDYGRIFRVVLAPFLPTHGIFQYTLPSLETKADNENVSNNQYLLTRERLESANTSLQELMTHRHNQGVDNTGNICVWDSEQTLAYCMVKHVAEHIDEWLNRWRDADECLDILELGSGMAGLSGLALTVALQRQSQQPVRLWLTDGHPNAIENNRVTIRLAKISKLLGLQSLVSCQVLPWSTEAPESDEPTYGCHVALVSDCTHFQDFHAHLFLTLAYRVRVGGSVYMCQPHRGKSLGRFLDLIAITGGRDVSAAADGPLFRLEWLQIKDLATRAAPVFAEDHYDPNTHCPQWIAMHKLRDVRRNDREQVLKHMETRRNASNGY